jgi:hypothetical protein
VRGTKFIIFLDFSDFLAHTVKNSSHRYRLVQSSMEGTAVGTDRPGSNVVDIDWGQYRSRLFGLPAHTKQVITTAWGLVLLEAVRAASSCQAGDNNRRLVDIDRPRVVWPWNQPYRLMTPLISVEVSQPPKFLQS